MSKWIDTTGLEVCETTGLDEDDNFLSGVWFCVQYLVITRRETFTAKEILNACGYTVDELIEEQKRSGY
jgi:hypothetical protein